MNCNNCGTENEKGTKFCKNCGKELKVKEGLGTASLVIGIFAIIFSFIFTLFNLILSITGLVLGIVNKAKGGKKVSGIVLNAIATFFSIVMFFVYIVVGVGIIGAVFTEISNNPELQDEIKKGVETIEREVDRQSSSNYLAGDYNCKGFDGSVEDSEYLVRLELGEDYKFMWGKYGETSNNYVKGSYSFNDLDKKNASGEYSYYTLNINGDTYVENGITQAKPNPQEYEFGITTSNGKKQGILMNTKTQNMYYCYEE